MLDDKTKELIAIGCSVAANCQPCVKFHIDKARQMGVEAEAIRQAVRVGRTVRRGAAGEMDSLLADLAGPNPTVTEKNRSEDSL